MVCHSRPWPIVIVSAACLLLACASTSETQPTVTARPRKAGESRGADFAAAARPAVPPDLKPAAPRPTSSHAPVVEALAPELERAMRELGRQQPRPHFLAYSVYDRAELSMRAANGTLESDALERRRSLDVDVRVGTPQFDSHHGLPGARAARDLNRLPLDDEPAAMRAEAWSATLARYHEAATRYRELVARRQSEEKSGTGQFTAESPHVHLEAPVSLGVDRAVWRQLLRSASARLREAPQLFHTLVDLQATALNRSFVSSDGSRVQTGDVRIDVTIFARTLSPRGEVLEVNRRFFASEATHLPNEAQLGDAVSEVIREADELRRAPLGDTFDGPALLAGSAAGVFMHEVLGHRLEAEKLREESYGKTFDGKLGEALMPSFLSVYDDPTVAGLGTVDLAGAYRFDDEGVPAERAKLIESGLFRDVLRGRTAVLGFPRSNGHGRRREGYPVFARQGNLVTQPSLAWPHDALRAELRAEAARQGKSYGIFVADIQSGSTHTAAGGGSQSVTVRPTQVFRVYTDGRSDERIRGVNLVGTPLTLLSKIMAAGDDYKAFNAVCGSGSGPVNHATISPSLLIRQVELERVRAIQTRPPVLTRPEPKDTPGIPESGDAAVRQAMAREIARSMSGLKAADGAVPQHVQYTVTDAEFAYASANFGAVTTVDSDAHRSLRVDVRVANEGVDSGNFVDPDLGPAAIGAPRRISMEDDPTALRLALWSLTDESFRRATRLLTKKRSVEAGQPATPSESASASPESSRASPSSWSPAPATTTVSVGKGWSEPTDSIRLAAIAKTLSVELRAFSTLTGSNVQALHHRVRDRVLSNEGSWKDERRAYVEIFVTASAQSTDGRPSQNVIAFDGAGPTSLPPMATMQAAVRAMAKQLVATTRARVPESGTAVVIFEGRAAGQLMRQILAKELSATPPARTIRGRNDDPATRAGAGAFADKLGQKVAPHFFTAVDDPRAAPAVRRGDFGAYAADEEADPSSREKSNTRGDLTGLYMSRTPSRKL